MIVSHGWLTVAVEQCHHRDATSSIFTSLTLAVTDLVTTGKFNLPTPPATFSFPLWSRTLLCCVIAGDFLFALLAEEIHSTSRILLYKPCNLCQSLFTNSFGTLCITQLSHIWMHWLTKSPYLKKGKFSFFKTSQLSSNLAFRSPKVHAHSHVKQNQQTFLYSFNTTVSLSVSAL